MKRWLFLMAVVLLTFTASGAFAQVVPWEIRYFGNVAPDAEGSCGQSLGTLYRFQLDGAGNTALGSVVADAAATDGYAYRILDNDPFTRLKWRSSSNNLDMAAGATIVARIKTASDTGGLANIGILGSNLSAGLHWGGANGNLSEPCRTQSATVTGDGAYHILRLTSQGAGLVRSAGYTETFTYADGTLSGLGGIPGEAGTSWQGAALTEISVVNNQLKVYGAHNTTNTLPCLVDPDVNGKITVIVNAKPDAEEVSPDGWVFTLYATDTSGVTLGTFQATGYHTVKGRCGGNDTPQATLTTGVYAELKMVIDTVSQTTEYFVNGVAIPTGTGTHVNPVPFSTQVTGKRNRLATIGITSFNDSRTPNSTWWLDDLQLIGTHVSGRTVNLYVDENPTPALSIIDAVAGAGGTDAFMMGSASPCATDGSDAAAEQDVYIDWISATAAGAFAPGQEAATIGHSLVVNPTPATTVEGARNAGPTTEVQLTGAYVTAAYYDFDALNNSVPIGFAIVDGTGAPRGIRVAHGDLGRYVGEIVDLGGSVANVNGEPVLYAGYVTDIAFTPESDPLLRPYGMNGKSSGGAMLPLAYADAFTYADGPVAGNGGWIGPLTSTIAVDTNTVKVKGGLAVGQPESITVTPNVAGGNTTVSLKIKKGVGGGSFWDIYVKNGAAQEMAHIWGSGDFFRCKVGGNVVGTAATNLTGGWDTLSAVVGDTTTEFFFNNASLGSAAHDGGAGVASIQLGSGLQNAMGATTDYCLFDDLSVNVASSESGMSTMGVRTTLTGRVTGKVDHTLNTWDGYFYIDDGSAIYDGNAAMYGGIRCRAASSEANGNFYQMPYEGDWVNVTGIMGVSDVNGKKVRYFWTWDFTTIYE